MRRRASLPLAVSAISDWRRRADWLVLRRRAKPCGQSSVSAGQANGVQLHEVRRTQLQRPAGQRRQSPRKMRSFYRNVCYS
ncbi:non-specific lipid-transfer protein ap10 [Phtheirospermum japonicum]|uniref:Non-specific lipid-transfer protein ap10 n=1 Tax=Phtheirospermum japonicum TaxID=374723 RepID=A0A830CAR8_9LAMI|nr:non-specific lipid-transfer protein ap10 [Phtheirospermum japonicum]